MLTARRDFPLCAITASVAAFPSPSGTDARYPRCLDYNITVLFYYTIQRNILYILKWIYYAVTFAYIVYVNRLNYIRSISRSGVIWYIIISARYIR